MGHLYLKQVLILIVTGANSSTLKYCFGGDKYSVPWKEREWEHGAVFQTYTLS